MRFSSTGKCNHLFPITMISLLLHVFFLCFASPSFSLSANIFSEEMRILLDFKASVSDPSGLLSNWVVSNGSNNFEHCSWYGVVCDSNFRVSSIRIIGSGGNSEAKTTFCFDVSKFPFYGFGIRRTCSAANGKKLTGKLSSEIAKLENLRALSLPFNEFSGEIPFGIWDLENLEVLELEGNSFSGHLPTFFKGLGKLRVLNLGFNQIIGKIPNSLSKCVDLEVLNLAGNGIKGPVPRFFGGYSKLWGLYLSMNLLDGKIPRELGDNCENLEYLDLSGNMLNGSIPRSLGGCGQLRVLLLFSNRLQGGIPSELGQLQRLEVLDVSRNSLTGPVPAELGKCVRMSVLVLSNLYDPFDRKPGGKLFDLSSTASGESNFFQGSVPMEITTLPKLKVLWVPRGGLKGEIPSSWGACDRLEMINLSQNFLTGRIEGIFAGCRRLIYVDLSLNRLSGELDEKLPIPCMALFNISGNLFSGHIPSSKNDVCHPMPVWVSGPALLYEPTFAYLSFFAYKARSFPFSSKLVVIHDFGGNHFTGSIPSPPISPSRLGRMTEYAFLADGNNLTGIFPGHLFDICDRLKGMFAKVSNNKLSGRIPVAVDILCGSLKFLDASGNRISGFIPGSLGSMRSLVLLNLNHKNLHGPPPIDLGQLNHLKYMALAAAGLNDIASFFRQLHTVNFLNLSSRSPFYEIQPSTVNSRNLSVLVFNEIKLSAQIDSVVNASDKDLHRRFLLNADLVNCTSIPGNPLFHSCQTGNSSLGSSSLPNDLENQDLLPPSEGGSSHGGSKFNSIKIATVISGSAIIFVLLSLVSLLICMRKCTRKDDSRVQVLERREITTFADIGCPVTYESIVKATDCFSASNCIGSGGFGATYRAEISPGVLVAVKRLAVGRFHGVQQFHAEIETLSKIRHRNLVTLIGYHASETEMLLVYNYLAGGNLERFIQEKSMKNVNWKTLHKIALDVAKALAYLHDECDPRVIHRDVKPSNILLDNDFNAYLSDFGLSRLLESSETHATTGVAGTFGYLAPEYALTCRVSDKCDVYSYGVMLLELISDKKALDPSFSSHGDGFNIVSWASILLRQGQAKEAFTAGLWDAGPQDDLVQVLHLAVKCTVEHLSVRPTMNQVMRYLKRLRPSS
ncbi:hypothetical protein Ancab_020888 [Ancistrocladus abbreviatus]